jgi:hypothetical protein
LKPPLVPAVDEVRPFPQHIRASIESVLDRIPKEAPTAFVAAADTHQIVVAVRVNRGAWSFSGYLDKKYTGPLIVGAEAIWVPGFKRS